MFGFRSMKDIKKKLKRKRRPIWTLAMLAGLFLLAAASGVGGAWLVGQAVFDMPAIAMPAEPDPAAASSAGPQATEVYAGGSREALLQSLSQGKGEVEVVVRRIYWCGEETRLLGRQSTEEASRLLKSRRDWEASFDTTGRLVFVSKEDNASPACRQNAYVGMDKDGNLSLFDGPPSQDNVVRTFFQLDVRSLESSISPDMLRGLSEGIRVADPKGLDNVVTQYKAYSRE